MARIKKATARPLMPKVDYTDFINTLAREHARHRAATVEQRILRNNPNFEEDVFREYLEYLKEKFEQWRELGNHYAEVLENPTTTAVLHNTIGEDLDELADQAKLDITSPEVLRLLYPLLRFRALYNQRKKPLVEVSDESPSGGNVTLLPVHDAPSSYVRCAEIIADLIAAEDTPEVLRSALKDFTTELSNHVSEAEECTCSPDTARKHLPALLERAEAAGWRMMNGMWEKEQSVNK